MRAVIQRVKKASVNIENEVYSGIATGLVILLGICEEDTMEDIKWMVNKILNMRIFSDSEGKMNYSIEEYGGGLMVISQFTLFGSTKKGNRPSFIKAAKPDIAIPLYDNFLHYLKSATLLDVVSGSFGADMNISLINQGPVTIIIDSKNKE